MISLNNVEPREWKRYELLLPEGKAQVKVQVGSLRDRLLEYIGAEYHKGNKTLVVKEVLTYFMPDGLDASIRTMVYDNFRRFDRAGIIKREKYDKNFEILIQVTEAPKVAVPGEQAPVETSLNNT